jgi:hypothetical protein
MQVGDLVRFKLDTRDYLLGGSTVSMTGRTSRDMYPYKYEIGLVVPGSSPYHTYISFPSRPAPSSYIGSQLEIISKSR